MTDSERPLDTIDRKIIALLTADGRMSINKLANQVSISRASAYSRVERLRTSGVIEGFTTADQPPQGRPRHRHAHLRQRRSARMEDAAAQAPRLARTGAPRRHATGTFDFSLLVRVPDMQTLRDVVLERLQAMPEVRSTQTAFVLDEHRPGGYAKLTIPWWP